LDLEPLLAPFVLDVEARIYDVRRIKVAR